MDRARESVQPEWKRAAVVAGATYFILFAAAVSLLDALSRLIVVPGFDGAQDFDIQEPILIVTCWVAAMSAASGNGVPLRPGPRLLMGLTGFVLLVVAEAYVSLALENEAPIALAREFATPNGLLRLLGYAAFGLTPLVQIWARLQLPDHHGDGANSVRH